MDSRILYKFVILTSIELALVGCTSGPRSSAAAENKLIESVDKLGLTELAAAPAVRRIWSGPQVDLESRPSPDGRLFSKTDWNSGNLVLYDVAKGTSRALTGDATWEDLIAFAETSIIAPDGKSVAYGWYTEKSDGFQLRILGLSGADSGKIRTVFSQPHGMFVNPQAWTPDGTEVIAVLTPKDGLNQIAAIRASDGKSRILRTVDWRFPSNMAVSPDGRWIAYDFPSDGDDKDVYLIGVDGSGDKAIARYKGDDVVMGWTGTDGWLLISSERSGTPSTWALNIVDGNTVGSPVLVRANMWRTIPIATAANGRIFYSVTTGEVDVFSVAVDPSTGSIRSTGTSVSGGSQNVNPQAFDWSPDGEHMAYAVRRGGGIKVFGPQDILVRSVKRANVRRIAPRMSEIFKLRWLPDGRSMLLHGADDKGEYGIFKMDIGNGSLTRLLRAERGRNYPRNVTILPGGKRIFFTTYDSSDAIINELSSAGEVSVVRRIKTSATPFGMTSSPDGKSIALGLRNAKPGGGRLIVIPVDGGAEKEVYRLGMSEELSLSGVIWTRDGRSLIFGVNSAVPQNLPDDIRRLSLADGKVTSTGLSRVGFRSMRLSPDGQTLMYGVHNGAAEMWEMDAPVFGPGGSIVTK